MANPLNLVVAENDVGFLGCLRATNCAYPDKKGGWESDYEPFDERIKAALKRQGHRWETGFYTTGKWHPNRHKRHFEVDERLVTPSLVRSVQRLIARKGKEWQVLFHAFRGHVRPESKFVGSIVVYSDWVLCHRALRGRLRIDPSPRPNVG